MAVFALTDTTTYLHGYDLTTDLNKVSVKADADDLDTTTFGSGGYKSRIAGLRSVQADFEGFWQSAAADAVDPQAFTSLGTADRVCTVSPTGVAATTAYLFHAGAFTYEAFGQIGEAAPFTLSAMGTNNAGLIRGQLAKAKGTVSATGALGSVLNLGSVSAAQYLYATFHIFGTPGTTITVVLETDDAAPFGSGTTVATIGPLTTAGGTWATRTAGPLTDTFQRFRVTGITGTFSVAAAAGIG